MFKVLHKRYYDEIHIVYAVMANNNGETMFLFYDGDWNWVKAIDYRPYKD